MTKTIRMLTRPLPPKSEEIQPHYGREKKILSKNRRLGALDLPIKAAIAIMIAKDLITASVVTFSRASEGDRSAIGKPKICDRDRMAIADFPKQLFLEELLRPKCL